MVQGTTNLKSSSADERVAEQAEAYFDLGLSADESIAVEIVPSSPETSTIKPDAPRRTSHRFARMPAPREWLAWHGKRLLWCTTAALLAGLVALPFMPQGHVAESRLYLPVSRTTVDKADVRAALLAECDTITSGAVLDRAASALSGEVAKSLHESVQAQPLDESESAATARAPSIFGWFALAGVVAGLAWSLVAELRDDRIRCVDEVNDELGVAVLGVVPRIPRRRAAVGRAMISHLDPRGTPAEAFRSIRTRLQLVARTTDRALRTILVTSPEHGEGRSLVAVNLAVALAQGGRSVLLIDADCRNPALTGLLDLQHGNGLLDVLESPKLLRWSIQSSGVDGLDVLPGGAAALADAGPDELIERFRLRAILAAPTGKYDHIIFDSPPVNPVADALSLAGECDATIVVVRADQTARRQAAKALDALADVGARVAGVVVNAAPTGRRYGISPPRLDLGRRPMGPVEPVQAIMV